MDYEFDIYERRYVIVVHKDTLISLGILVIFLLKKEKSVTKWRIIGNGYNNL